MKLKRDNRIINLDVRWLKIDKQHRVKELGLVSSVLRFSTAPALLIALPNPASAIYVH